MNKQYFEGYYYKLQKDDETVAFIKGSADGKEFIQVITNEGSDNFTEVNNCSFSESGIRLNTPQLQGEVIFYNLTPFKYNIMGPFQFFPMECKHGIVSMHHKIKGSITIKGKKYNFDNGTGYIETDSGCSFPKEYVWIQCNDFKEKCSVMASVAQIPFMGFTFLGCICAIDFGGKQLRFATYNGVKIMNCGPKRLQLKHGNYKLDINIEAQNFAPLYAPVLGKMDGIIRECNNAVGNFQLYKKDDLLFDLQSKNVSYEYQMKQ